MGGEFLCDGTEHEKAEGSDGPESQSAWSPEKQSPEPFFESYCKPGIAFINHVGVHVKRVSQVRWTDDLILRNGYPPNRNGRLQWQIPVQYEREPDCRFQATAISAKFRFVQGVPNFRSKGPDADQTDIAKLDGSDPHQTSLRFGQLCTPAGLNRVREHYVLGATGNGPCWFPPSCDTRQNGNKDRNADPIAAIHRQYCRTRVAGLPG